MPGAAAPLLLWHGRLARAEKRLRRGSARARRPCHDVQNGGASPRFQQSASEVLFFFLRGEGLSAWGLSPSPSRPPSSPAPPWSSSLSRMIGARRRGEDGA